MRAFPLDPPGTLICVCAWGSPTCDGIIWVFRVTQKGSRSLRSLVVMALGSLRGINMDILGKPFSVLGGQWGRPRRTPIPCLLE